MSNPGKKDTNQTVKGACNATIGCLIAADKLLAKTAINDAKATLVNNSKNQDKVDKEIAKAEEENLQRHRKNSTKTSQMKPLTTIRSHGSTHKRQ